MRIAALPMYDLPELRGAHDRLWAALAQRLQAAAITSVPAQLTRGLSCREIWSHPALLFGQACEYPAARFFRDHLQIVATPRYGAAGCAGTSYRSAIIVRADEPANGLEDLRNRRCVANEPDSNSGMNLLRAALAPIARGGRFFESVRFSGSHRSSMEAVANGEADVTAVDCVTLAHLQRYQPLLTSRLRVIDWTPASPCLPFVTTSQVDVAVLQALRVALEDVFADRALAADRAELLLEGIDLSPDGTFARVRQLERAAERLHYPTLS